MGLLSECKYCHQFVSTKRLVEHIHASHASQLREEKPAPRVGKGVGPAVKQPSKALKAPANKPSTRLTRAEEEQEVRRRVQAKKNAVTAKFIQDTAIQRANREVSTSVWKEQVAKLSTVKAKPLQKKASPERFRVLTSYQAPLFPHTSQPSPPSPISEKPQATLPSKPKRWQERPPVKMSKLRSRPALRSYIAPSVAPTRKQQSEALVSIPCSCGGTNERCYKCDGFGYQEVSASLAKRYSTDRASLAKVPQEGPASFSSDSRGNSYGVRELGRFSSAPIHDDYTDESVA